MTSPSFFFLRIGDTGPFIANVHAQRWKGQSKWVERKERVWKEGLSMLGEEGFNVLHRPCTPSL